jgi:hypothetical protein
MSFLTSYGHLLSIDVVALLDKSTDRSETLDEHISLLENYGQDAAERILSIDEQISELSTIVSESSSKANSAKAVLDSTYA